jgi:hypothetical protein
MPGSTSRSILLKYMPTGDVLNCDTLMGSCSQALPDGSTIVGTTVTAAMDESGKLLSGSRTDGCWDGYCLYCFQRFSEKTVFSNVHSSRKLLRFLPVRILLICTAVLVTSVLSLRVATMR